MADAKKCNICGTFYDDYETKFKVYLEGCCYYCYISPFLGVNIKKYPDVCKGCFKKLMSKIMNEIEKM